MAASIGNAQQTQDGAERGSAPLSVTTITIRVEHRKFIVRDLDMHRASARKASVAAQKMDPVRAAAFLEVVDTFERAIIWERFSRHVADALESAHPLSRRFNIYELNASINRVLRDIERWAWRNQSFPPSKVAEFRAQIVKSAGSICRVFDKAATCWRRDVLVEVARHG